MKDIGMMIARGDIPPLWVVSVVLFALQASLVPGTNGQTGGYCEEVCPDKACPNVYDPVCGSNNKTYKNDCVFTCAYCTQSPSSKIKLTMLHRGVCECDAPKDCVDDYHPVCGTDHNDYSNICQLRLANNCRSDMDIMVKNVGSCEPDPSDPLCQSRMVCAAMYAPVCGSDGRTYGNACLLSAANVCRLPSDIAEIKYPGECTSFGLKTWMAVAIAALICLALVLLCCIFLLRLTKKGTASRYEVHRSGKEEF